MKSTAYWVSLASLFGVATFWTAALLTPIPHAATILVAAGLVSVILWNCVGNRGHAVLLQAPLAAGTFMLVCTALERVRDACQSSSSWVTANSISSSAVAFALGCSIAAVVAVPIGALRIRVTRRHTRLFGKSCTICKYPRAGLAESVICPECGNHPSEDQTGTWDWRHWWPHVMALFALVASVCVVRAVFEGPMSSPGLAADNAKGGKPSNEPRPPRHFVGKTAQGGLVMWRPVNFRTVKAHPTNPTWLVETVDPDSGALIRQLQVHKADRGESAVRCVISPLTPEQYELVLRSGVPTGLEREMLNLAKFLSGDVRVESKAGGVTDSEALRHEVLEVDPRKFFESELPR